MDENQLNKLKDWLTMDSYSNIEINIVVRCESKVGWVYEWGSDQGIDNKDLIRVLSQVGSEEVGHKIGVYLLYKSYIYLSKLHKFFNMLTMSLT